MSILTGFEHGIWPCKAEKCEHDCKRKLQFCFGYDPRNIRLHPNVSEIILHSSLKHLPLSSWVFDMFFSKVLFVSLAWLIREESLSKLSSLLVLLLYLHLVGVETRVCGMKVFISMGRKSLEEMFKWDNQFQRMDEGILWIRHFFHDKIQDLLRWIH